VHTVHAGSRDQQLLGRSPLRHPFPKLDLFVGAQHHAFAGGRAHHIARESGGVPLLDVVLDFNFPDLAFVIEGRGDGAEDALQFHRCRFIKGNGVALKPPPERYISYFAM
jgi:hypothetical protein